MSKVRNKKGYWTKDKCITDALNYKTKSEWSKKSGSAYITTLNNGWMSECCAHMTKLGSKYKRLIYSFEFSDNSIYVGLTFDSNQRMLAHLSNSKSQVYKYIQKTELEPEFKILTEYIDKDVASKLEGEFVDKYRNDGWTILNKAKTGGLGGDTLIWTKEKCLEDALKYKTKTEWQNNSSGAYNAAHRNKWSEECCKHMIEIKKPDGYWTLENCKRDALNYKTRKEWGKNSSGAYRVARINKWLDECCKHMDKPTSSRLKWTKEKCKNDALNYKTRTEWSKKSSGAYEAAKRNKWIDECCEHMSQLIKPRGYWNLETSIKDALKYNTRIEWEKISGSAYQIAVNNGWINECCKHMIQLRKPNGYWTLEKCISDALKYNSKSEWEKISGSAYNSAVKNKWLDKCCVHMSRPQVWNKGIIKNKIGNI